MNLSQPAGIEAVVFDFDGTLAELCLDFGVMKSRLAVLARDYLRYIPTPSSLPALEWLDALAGMLLESGSEGAAEFRSRAHMLILDMEMEAAREGRLFPFTRPILQDLRMRGVKAGIITRNCTRAVQVVFPDMDRYCGCFLSRDHVPRVKPDPYHLLRAIEELSADPGRSLIVGDHPLDIETGRRAGVLTAGVSSGRISRGDLSRSGADWVASDCEELMSILRREALI